MEPGKRTFKGIVQKVCETERVRLSDSLATHVNVSGLSNTFGDTVSLRRRVIWSVVVLAALGWMTFLIAEGVVVYFKYPSSVTIELTQEQKVPFPAVTICNQNIMSARKLFGARKNYVSPTLMEAVKAYVDIDSRTQELIRQDQYWDTVRDHQKKYGELLEPYDVESLALQMRSEKQKFLADCSWMGELGSCSPDDFKTIISDVGVCYTYNGNTTTLQETYRAGKKGGLHLKLFVEHFDYLLQGARTDAGAVAYIHDQSESPVAVSENGIALPVGFNSYIGVKTNVNNNLKPPHGLCGETPLTEFPNGTEYTRSRCHLNCLTKYIADNCGCIDGHMPGESGLPYCSLTQKLNCLNPTTEAFEHEQQREACKCPRRCEQRSYTHVTSYASISEQYDKYMALDTGDAGIEEYDVSLGIQDWYGLNQVNPNLTNHVDYLTKRVWELYYDYKAKSTTNNKEYVKWVKSLWKPKVKVSLFGRQAYNYAKGWQYTFPTREPGERYKLCLKRFHMLFPCLEKGNCVTDESKIHGLMAKMLIEKRHKVLNWVWLNATMNAHRTALGRLNKAKAHFNENTTSLEHTIVDSLIKQITNMSNAMNASIYHLLEVQGEMEAFAKVLQPYRMQRFRPTLGVWNVEFFTPDYFRNNFLDVEIFFQDLTVQYVTQNEAYTTNTLFSNVGGSIGLCIGGSVLTLVELIDVFITWWFKRREGKQSGDKYREKTSKSSEMTPQSKSNNLEVTCDKERRPSYNTLTAMINQLKAKEMG